MNLTIKNLFAIAVLTFTLSFVTGMSASMIYQEHQSLKPFIAAQETISQDVLIASTASVQR